MPDDLKIAVVLRDDLAPWQSLNVTAFLVSGIGTAIGKLVGESYEDADGVMYRSMFTNPVLIFAADRSGIGRAFDRARGRELSIAVYTDAMFATGNDVDNRAAVKCVATADLVLAGFSVVGDRRQVDKALDRLRLHP